MSAPTHIYGRSVVDYDIVDGESTTVAINSTGTVIVNLPSTKRGLQGYIIAFRQAWDGGSDTFVTYHLQTNFVNRPPYESSTVQLCAPEADYYLPVPIPVQEGVNVRMTADLSSSAPAIGTVSGRIIVAYVER